ncbi:MAG: AAA family ATPase [Ruminiclostridium sp.]
MVKINSLEIENVKRVKAVKLEPAENGITIIGGNNGQGKTSVLDAIAWALGGDRFKPTEPKREGSVVPPYLHITLSNGLVVERKGENGTLKVIDPNGNKGGQQLLNEFVEALALNLPKFMQASSKEKADTLLKIIGVGDKLYELETEEDKLYNNRRAIGQIADQKDKFAKEMPIYSGVPAEPITALELIKRQQEILARNGENQRKREQAERYNRELTEAQRDFYNAEKRLKEAEANAAIANAAAENLIDESTAELERNIGEIEQLNTKIRANLEKEKAEIEAEEYRKQYDDLTERIEGVRQAKRDLLNGADLPLEGLSVDKGELTYNGYHWDNMSASEQLRISTAIIRKLNPQCGFVLMDKLEQMDTATLSEFGKWLESEGLQVIATRVSTGDECSIIIEDGCVMPSAENSTKWKAGTF